MEPNVLDVAGEELLYRALRRFWHPVAYSTEADPGPVGAVLLDQRIVVARLRGAARAFLDLCAHDGTALSLGRVEGDLLRCPRDGWAYGPDGACVSMPARFGPSIPPGARLRPLRVAEGAGLVWVCLEGQPALPLPEFPEYGDPAFRVVQIPPYEWACSAARRIENYVDFSHFAWVHDGVLGSREEPEVPDHEVWREGGELRFGEGFFTDPHPSPETSEAMRRSRDRNGLPHRTGVILADKSYRLFMPGTVWLDQRLPGDRHYVLFFSTCPVGRKRTRCFTFMARDYDLDPAQDHKFSSFNDLIVGQDRPVVESQRPEELPYDLAAELHIRGADRVSLEYRRWLVELARSLAAPEG